MKYLPLLFVLIASDSYAEEDKVRSVFMFKQDAVVLKDCKLLGPVTTEVTYKDTYRDAIHRLKSDSLKRYGADSIVVTDYENKNSEVQGQALAYRCFS